MNLFIKISKEYINSYRKEFIECLKHNSFNQSIRLINVYTDEIDHNIVNIPKVRVIFKRGINSNNDLYRASKPNFSKMNIISEPFVKFNDLTSINESDLDEFIIKDKSYVIFSKDSKVDIKSNELIFLKKEKIKKIDTIHLRLIPIEIEVFKNKSDITVKKSKSSPRIQPTQRSKKLDVIIISVDYNDYLILTLEENSKIFDNITVVTSTSDTICQKICEKFGVRCVITDKMYEENAIFNKGKAINEGIKSIENPDLILLLDADIIVENKINLEVLSDDILYTSERIILPSYQSYQNYKNNKLKNKKIEPDKGYGFFQLFCINNKFINKENPFPETSNDASWSDINFRDKFEIRKRLGCVLHLGEAFLNWKGRRTDSFITEEQLNEKISETEILVNNVFDNIYCLNLEERKDRWNRVLNQFLELNINVQRWNAISGNQISDDLLQDYNPNGINGEEASEIGVVENKNAIGCLLSHIEIIKDAKLKGYKKILIFEDDVIIDKSINLKIKESLKINWKLLYLGASQFDWKGIETINGFYKSHKTLGTFAYAVDETIYDEIIETFENNKKSIDNLLTLIQEKYNKECYTFSPNIVISDVEDSDIRQSKNIIDYAIKNKWPNNLIKTKLNILLVPDTRGWAFDNISNSIVNYNPYTNKIKYDTVYVLDILNGHKIEYDEYDYIFVFFEAERCIPDSKKIIRGCYSAFWLEDKRFTENKLGEYFNKCKASVYANETLRNHILPNIKEKQPTIIIPDASNEELFYPIEGEKGEKFTAIFVGNTERKIKNFNVIKSVCKKADVDLIICRDIDNSKLVNYYNKADVCINFSDFEGGPQTFIESALCGVPMIIKSCIDLSKEIPCFTSDTEEDLLKTLIELKDKRSYCKYIGKRARKVALEKFTYKKTAEKFADFFLNLETKKYFYKKDLSDTLTVFIISCGENPNYNDCLSALEDQNVIFKIKQIKNVSPMSAAFQKMIDDCDTDYYIQVDEDMILFENTIETIFNSLVNSDEKISTVAFRLKDTHLDFDLYGIKGYKHDIMKNYSYNLDIISCEVEQIKRLQSDGYQTLMNLEIVGLHSPKWNEDLIYERYFDLMEKWKSFGYDWLSELPSKLLKIFKEDPSDINFFALAGAIVSISDQNQIRKQEKNFNLKNEHFLRIKKMTSIQKFNHITSDDKVKWMNYVKKEESLDSNKMFKKNK
jgi:GR25 family glycosyltransferase involved in LPS biosynthesis